jgi:hypothetical protein
MTKDQLLAKHPGGNIKSDPLTDCPKCKGHGRILTPGRYVRICVCVQIGGAEDYRRVAVRGILNN